MPATGDRNSTISPPAGLGSVPGLGEAFRMNLNTGQGVYSYKIALPDGIAGYTPNVILEYSHGTRLEQFGYGWKLPLRSIERRLDVGAPEEGAHETFLDGSSEIVQLRDGSFGALTETSFSRYTRAGDGWKVEERDGTVHELGTTPAARVENPDGSGRVQRWLIDRSSDASGNSIEYIWNVEGFAYPAEIRYAVYALRFVYEPRPDVRLDGKAGFLIALKNRCKRIELYLDPGPQEKKLRTWTLTYDSSGPNGVSLVTSIQLTCFATSPEMGGDVVRSAARFTYNSFNPEQYSLRFFASEAGDPPTLDDQDVALVNLDQAPLPGILHAVGGDQYYWRNSGAGWDAPQKLSPAPFACSFARAGVAFMDMNGNGKPDLMLLAPGSVPGYYENDGQRGWGRFVAYPRDKRTTPNWLSNRLRLADTDANGRIDAIESTDRGFVVWRNEGENGWSDPELVPADRVGEGPDVDFSNPLIAFADMTGDGLSDIVEINSGSVRYWPDLGDGRYGAGVNMQNSPRLPDLRERGNVFLLDVDGDGCADLVRIGTNDVTVTTNRNGASFGDLVVLGPIPAPIPGTIRVANLEGTATAGLTWNSYKSGSRIGYVHFGFNTSRAPYLLASVDNGSGLVSELWYRSAVEDYLRDRADGMIWNTNFPFPLLVVARTRETDQVSGQVNEIQYRYHEAHYEPHTRRFEGFRTAEKIEKGDESCSDRKTIFQYLMAIETLPGNRIEHAALNGCLARTDLYSLDGSSAESLPLVTEKSDYQITTLSDAEDGTVRTFLAVTANRVIDLERTTDFRAEEKKYTYDEFGNVIREVHRGFGKKDGTDQAEQIRTTEISYAKSATRRLLGKACSVVVRDGNGKIISETRSFFDGADFVGMPFGQADRGLLTRQLQLASSQADFSAHYDASMSGATALGYILDADHDGVPSEFVQMARHAYDKRGLKIAYLDPMGAEKRFEYDTTGLFRTGLVTALGETRFEYARAIGQPTRITYADNTNVRLTYDSQGRLLWTALPGEDPSHPPRVYSYNDSMVPNMRTVRMRQSAGPEFTSEVLTYFDAHGNEFQQRIQVDTTSYVVSGRRLLNPWGDLKQEFEPVFSNSREFSIPDTSGAASRILQYDARGRVVRAVNYNGGISTARFRPFAVEMSDANDNDHSNGNIARGQADTPRREEFDVFRHRTAVVESLGADAAMTTRYISDSQGRIAEIRDELGTLCTYRYDLIGNRCEISHRAAGRRRLWYDGRGRVVRSLDANENDLRVDMDILGRLRTLSSRGVTLEEYTYENADRNVLGSVSKVSYRGGFQVLAYDAAGKVIHNEFHFDGLAGPHRIDYEYDYLGRETAQVHSDGLRIEKKLTLNGWIKSIPGIISEVAYNARGLPQTISFTNGVKTELRYLDGPGRVSSQRTTGPHGEVYEDLSYGFDLMGLLVKSADAASGGRGNAAYQYDPLYQLKTCLEQTGDSPVTQRYDYFNHLNLTQFDETGSVLRYDDSQHPDRVSSVISGDNPRTDVKYDANGNILTLPGKTFAYNEKNELVRFVRTDGVTAEYAYDPHGRRISKRVADGHGLNVTTFFIGPDVEIQGNQTMHFIRLGQRRVAIASITGTQFVHSDYSGSTSFFTDPHGAKLASLVYRPFGNVVRTNGVVASRTYSLHPFDAESGLYYMRRRFYAPEIGRFLTPDPLAVYQPQKLNGNAKALHPYAYVANDPLNNIDYDGLSFWSVVGAFVGVVAAVVVAAAVVALSVATGGLFAVLLGAALTYDLVLVSYSIADANRGTGLGEFFRGFMIGLNAGLNAVIGTAIFGPVVGIALGVINFLAAFDGIAGNRTYQGILGWTSWLMPMSWLATGVGLIFFEVNVIAAAGTFQQWGATKINKISIHWETGTIVVEGGLIRPAGGASGFNMGNFAFLSPGSTQELHETGHGLNVAAFGSIFHFVAALDQNAFGSGPDCYSELLADSHDPNYRDPYDKGDPTQWWHMWGDPSQGAG